MSAMSASPPVGLPLSLIAEHKVAGTKPPSASAAIPTPSATAQQVALIPPVSSTSGVAAAIPVSNPGVAVPSGPQPQTNGMEPAVAPAPSVVPPQVSVSPPPPTPPQSAVNSANNSSQGNQNEGGPVAPGSGTSTSGGSSEVEVNSAAVGDVPPVDAQPSVPPTQATVPPPAVQQQVVQDAPVPHASSAPIPQPQAAPAAAEVAPQPAPLPTPPVQSLPPAPVEASPPPSSAPAALPPTLPPAASNKPIPSSSKPASVNSSKTASSPSKPNTTPSNKPGSVPVSSPTAVASAPLVSPQENAKPSRVLKRKLQSTEGEGSAKKALKVDESTKIDEDARKGKRSRLPTQPYQSPIPELNMIAKMNNTSKTPKGSEEKLIVFYRNEFLAVRNAEGGFYVCQTIQNIYRPAPGQRSKIKIRWFSQGPNDVFTPDFYDSTEFDCILTNLNLDKLEKDKYKLPPVEKQRTESILKRAIDAEKGEAAVQALTEEHPDGLDLSLYRHEDQLKKRGKNKKEQSKKKTKSPAKAPPVAKPSRTSSRNSGGSIEESVKEKSKTNEKNKSRSSKKKKKVSKKIEKTKKKEPESNSKKESVEHTGRKTANSGATQSLPARKTADKTKSAVVAKQTSKAPAGVTKQPDKPAQRSTRTATPKQ